MQTAEEKIKDSLATISTMVELGRTDKEIAEAIGVGYSTYRRYKSNDPEVKAIISEGKEKKNQEVEKALFDNATGYHYYEEVVTKVKNEVVIEDKIVVKEDVKISKVKKYAKPLLDAQKYWLENKDKMHWKGDPSKFENDKKMLKLKEKEVNARVVEMDV